ncbi:hypothetical protein GI374_11420 [Paracoccus sp. S-4012]|uniref:hypothetical protein n=1 Tax=Paracoccus sp. S-4012 TaxID=2665648 RepID=UPI0012AF4B7E|nr:hypothetical protein [Paracoccus sp. S-4012]MRX51047.1 hypothetical protein [Paracoccus sp. S-4012]
MLKSRQDVSTLDKTDGGGAALNPFCALGPPGTPLRMMFAPFEVATFLPAYAIDTFHGRRSGRR